MPDMKYNDSASAQLLPIVTPAPAVPSLGEWHGRGLRVGDDPDVFSLSHGDPGVQARQICAGCAVRDDCLKFAIDADEFGIWGGLDREERRSFLRDRTESA